MQTFDAQTTGCRWTGLTVSKQQLEEGVARVKAADLSDRITLLFCDYRQAAHLGPFDKVPPLLLRLCDCMLSNSNVLKTCK